MNRFLDCGQDVFKILDIIQEKYFKELRSAKIKCIFDTKKRKSKGKILLANVRKTNELMRHLTAEEAETEEGFDYILTIDQKAWGIMSDIDKERLVRHELRHIEISGEDVKDPFKIIPHDIEDFVIEVKLNQDDPGWAQRVCTMMEDIYAQEKEAEKEAKKSKGKKKIRR